MSASEVAVLARDPATAGRVVVTGLGGHLPETVVGNEDIAADTGVDSAWIERRTGIVARRRSPAGEELLDLVTPAAHRTLRDAGVAADELDLVLLASVSQGRPMPPVAPQLAHAIGATRAGAFDLGAACSGFVIALANGCAFIEAGRARHVLVVAADQLSRQTDPSDRRTAALFGDGAAAVLLSRGSGEGSWAMELGCDGSSARLIENDRDSGLIRMDGHATFIQAVRRMEQSTRSVCRRAGVSLADVDLFVFHQANARITRALVERLGVGSERVADCIAMLGNTSAASVPLALEQVRGEGRLQAGDRVLVAAFGAGLVWGAMLIEWGTP